MRSGALHFEGGSCYSCFDENFSLRRRSRVAAADSGAAVRAQFGPKICGLPFLALNFFVSPTGAFCRGRVFCPTGAFCRGWTFSISVSLTGALVVGFLSNRCISSRLEVNNVGAGSMPTAERRNKQKAARQRAEAAAKAATTKEPDHTTTRSVAVQTTLEAAAVKEVIERYWMRLDSRGIDQQTEAYQFTIGSFSSGLRTHPSFTHAAEEEDAYDYQEDSDLEAYLLYLASAAEEEETERTKKQTASGGVDDEGAGKSGQASHYKDEIEQRPSTLDGMD